MTESPLSPSRPSASLTVVDDTYRLQSAVGSLCAGLARNGIPQPSSANTLLRLLAELSAAKSAPRKPKGSLTFRFFQVLGGSAPPVDAVNSVFEELEALNRVVSCLGANESHLQLALDFVAGTEARRDRSRWCPQNGHLAAD